MIFLIVAVLINIFAVALNTTDVLNKTGNIHLHLFFVVMNSGCIGFLVSEILEKVKS